MYAAYLCMSYMNYKKHLEYQKIKIKNNIAKEMIEKKEFEYIIDIRTKGQYNEKKLQNYFIL